METPDFMTPEVFVRLRLLGLTTEAIYLLYEHQQVSAWATLLDVWENQQTPEDAALNIGYWNRKARKHGHVD
jgi:hypothetical protein